MLFDLRGRGRRNTIKVIYITLAFLMGGGLVLFGIGGNTSGGGLVDAFTDGSGGDVGADRYKKQISAAKKSIAADPSDAVAYETLIRAQVGLAATGDQFDPNTGEYTSDGKADLRAAIDAWTAYLEIEPSSPAEQARVASRVVQAYAALEDLEGLVTAQEVVAENRNASGQYAALAQYAYLAGQTRKGDLAAKKALELEDPDQRSSLKSELDSYKQQAPIATPAAPEPTAEPKKTAAPKDEK